MSLEEHQLVKMKPTPNAAYIYDKQDDREKCLNDTRLHQEAVKQLMNVVAEEIRLRATYHDYSKLKHENLTFKEHLQFERHHLNHQNGVPIDVNVVDLVEFICDVVSAAAQRSGKLDYKLMRLPPILLNPIIKNSVNGLWKIVMIEDKEEGEEW